MPSRPPETPRPLLMVKVVLAPVMRNTASTLPTRSTTAMVPRPPRACASPTAWLTIFSTSAMLRNTDALGGGGLAGTFMGACHGFRIDVMPQLLVEPSGLTLARQLLAAGVAVATGAAGALGF